MDRVECPYCQNWAYADNWEELRRTGETIIWQVTYTCVECMKPHARKLVMPIQDATYNKIVRFRERRSMDEQRNFSAAEYKRLYEMELRRNEMLTARVQHLHEEIDSIKRAASAAVAAIKMVKGDGSMGSEERTVIPMILDLLDVCRAFLGIRYKKYGLQDWLTNPEDSLDKQELANKMWAFYGYYDWDDE